jgi:hypothetical protein
MEENKTTFIDVICNHAMLEIADIRLQTEMGISPAQFFRKMSLYVINAVPRFNRPPEAREWLKFTAPNYDDMEYIVPDGINQDQNVTIQTDKPGYEIVSVVEKAEDGYGAYEYIPIKNAEYATETGVITIPEGTVSSGDTLEIDFYTDGVFDRELGYDMKDILGLLIQYAWEFRFANDFLLQQPKIKDKSFDVGNEANHMRASTERMRMLQERINQRPKSFEQGIAYRNIVLENSNNTTYSPENN